MGSDDPPIVQATREFLESCDRTPEKLVYPVRGGTYQTIREHVDYTEGGTPVIDGILVEWSPQNNSEPHAVFREEVPING